MTNQTLNTFRTAIAGGMYICLIIGMAIFSSHTSELALTLAYVGNAAGVILAAGAVTIICAPLFAAKAIFDLYLSLED